LKKTIDPVFGLALRIMRKSRKLSMEQTALLAGVNSVYYGKIERGKHSPTVEIVDRVLTALEVDWMRFGMEVDLSRRGAAPR
jgi:transcriptional regulator with XRE-family HTH domain